MPVMLSSSDLSQLAVLSQITEEQAASLDSSTLLERWYALQQAWTTVQRIRDAELSLRKVVAGRFFPQPKEGTNRSPLEGGYDVKLVQTFDRSVDETVPQVFPRLREMGVSVDKLFPLVPRLSLTEYRKLVEQNTEDGKPNELLMFVDSFIVTKPGSPQITIVKAKR